MYTVEMRDNGKVTRHNLLTTDGKTVSKSQRMEEAKEYDGDFMENHNMTALRLWKTMPWKYEKSCKEESVFQGHRLRGR